ncbi:MAG: bifunctional diaminohydroxyphosphoribosylaminopyrimidine deaminase/5-amino-6-(5-phosphoribosylamino)uracil reductase RibD [Bacteroidota bacterium]|nr:bifunctional diaminohydroxyphosphoribosylaminopyrimidine deaminase/5-amino-6-(5-phosphoribosylamino)uracil reductase RibD [Bacteroidota bacterium]
MNIHETYMQQCLVLALQGFGKVAPNPMVGCVIVHDEKIIGEGYHQQYGQAHAEVNAINSVENKELLLKSTIYINLEPCSHYGKTPPCADLIIEHKIPNVVIGCMDSNSVVNGRGIEKLTKAGINVIEGVLEDECKELNKRFFTFHEKKRPYIILKWAQTTDGFIDAKRNEENPGKALQISNAECRKLVHQWRSQEQAIMVGTNTALLDNPQLTVRDWHGENPLRITIDKWLRIPKQNYLFDKSTPTLIFTALNEVSVPNLEFVKIDFEQAIIPQILSELYKRSIQSLLIEGGEQLLNSCIEIDAWDEARVFISDKKIEKGVKAPVLKKDPIHKENINGDKLLTFLR